ncbi:hypothetical protein CL615_04650 [archaeon]|jgi:hypothetical protein|nr:hypothetical protein [archaeon]MDP6548086.1 hypothetical protein [Candidatus Woesearchaeota archaeon]|tara:strand:+ start:9548 stop:9916 length:369 start_codon:yes stop_codon:yes gene_type:complete
MQNTSLEHINPANLKKFVRKLSIVSSRHENKQSYKIKPKEKKLLENKNTENALRKRVHVLEQELMNTREERDAALEENKSKINSLNIALLSVKERMKEFIAAKKAREKRIRHLEYKIKRKVK